MVHKSVWRMRKKLIHLLTPSSSRILAFGFNSRSYGLLRWLRTRRRCLSSTGFSWVTSGSITLHRLWSVMNVDDMDGTTGVWTITGTVVVVDDTTRVSWKSNEKRCRYNSTQQLTGSLNITGKSNLGKSMYKKRFSDFSVSAWFISRISESVHKIWLEYNTPRVLPPFYGMPICQAN